ncbi:hypothetical protein ES711_03785 [Gelidibacter salicanalis]|uniref:Uncharacterized protein n=1 Tax=Gelidibacter salicanalis TaxID=291193 RepID=A0A5C7AK15_9FLAO|nr:hypothetical protein [Gelidibacter salicanalis]TXE09066.1 hypothetical protein ES711_03785 [Gelidibacter salicanalis]
MKPYNQILVLLMLILGHATIGQTPEQQKMIDKATRMRDSLMECINLDEVMQQAEAQQKRMEMDIIKTDKSKNANVVTAKNNVISSTNNKKLANWNLGVADLVFNHGYDVRKDKVNFVKVGLIEADGTIVLNPSERVPDLKPLNNFKNSNIFYDIHNPDVYQYTNGETGFKLNSYLLVYQDDQKIGMLTIGNSEKVTLNLITPGNLYFGDEGYMMSWVYVEKDCAIKASEDWKGDLSNTSIPLIVATNVNYDLNFKAGWNLVKTEVIGTYHFPEAPEEDRSRYKKHRHTSVAAIPKDATYFFRSSSY